MSQKGYKRKLTAILSADVNEYSRLMREDDTVFWYAAETLERLNTLEAQKALEEYKKKAK